METNVKKIPHVEFWKIIYGWMLYFDPSPRPDTTASNRKRSRGRIKAYDMGQGEGLIVSLQSCTGRE